jgi:hypothetical protein
MVYLQCEAKEFFLAHDVGHRLVLQSAFYKRHPGVPLTQRKLIEVVGHQPGAVVQGATQGM